MATSRWACPRPIGEETNRARRWRERARRPAPVASGRARDQFDEVAQEQVHTHGIARGGVVATTLERHQGALQLAGEIRAALVRRDEIVRALDHQGGAGHRVVRRSGLLRRHGRGQCDREDLGGGLQTPAEGVLDLLRRMGFGEHVGEEELEEPAVVDMPVRDVDVVGERSVEHRRRHRFHVGARRDQRETQNPFGMGRREQRSPPGPLREPDDDGPVDPARVEDRDGVRDDLVVRVGVRPERAVGSPGATGVEGDHPPAAREVGDLALPDPGLHDLEARQQQEGRITFAEHLVADAHPVPLDMTGLVRESGTHHAPSRSARSASSSSSQRSIIRSNA